MTEPTINKTYNKTITMTMVTKGVRLLHKTNDTLVLRLIIFYLRYPMLAVCIATFMLLLTGVVSPNQFIGSQLVYYNKSK